MVIYMKNICAYLCYSTFPHIIINICIYIYVQIYAKKCVYLRYTFINDTSTGATLQLLMLNKGRKDAKLVQITGKEFYIIAGAFII